MIMRMALRAPGMMIGALIMVHSDDDGLVLPPRIAPIQVAVIPIAQHKEGVLDRAHELLAELKKAGYRVKIDDSEKSPGWKFSEAEMRGIPVRIEIGPKDIEANHCVIAKRNDGTKQMVDLDENLATTVSTFVTSAITTTTTILTMAINIMAER